MKSTIKLDLTKAVVVEPEGAAVRLSIFVGAISVYRTALTLDQCGALLFGVEQAALAAQAHRAAAAAR